MNQLGLNVISLTSLTPKEEVSAVYKTIQEDLELRLLYGKPWTSLFWLPELTDTGSRTISFQLISPLK